MSRTIRRRKGNQTGQNPRTPWVKRVAQWHYPDLPFEEALALYAVRFHTDGVHRRTMNTPSWWITCMMTRSQRQAVRSLLTEVMKLNDFEDAPLFPHPKKPFIYFW
jgi:hypothetical protein